MNENKKRKIQTECRGFNPQWTNNYLFTLCKDKIICLVCRETISVPKEYNLRRHFESKHQALSKLDANEKKLKAASLLSTMGEEQNFFNSIVSENKTITKISFQISREIAITGKPFTEGDFVKKCMLMAVSQLCPEKKKLFENISLSRMTVQRRITDISTNISDQLKRKARGFSYFSLCMDESTDIQDTAQLLVFIRGIDNFKISEDLIGLCPMSGRTTGKEIYNELKKCVTEKLGVDFTNLVSICTDGAPSMSGKNIGAVALLQEFIGQKIIQIHCIVHLQVLCSKVLNFEHVMKVLISVINYIRSSKLKHRSFKAFLEEVDTNCSDVLYHTDVRWLSRGRVLQRFVTLKSEISAFLENEQRKFPELKEYAWNFDLFFFCDITKYLNDLNTNLQGKNQSIFELLAVVKCFKMKLKLFSSQLLKGEMSHFPTCQQQIPQHEHINLGKKYAKQIDLLIEEFDRRFALPPETYAQLKLIEEVFSVDPEHVPLEFQFEIIELQSSVLYKNKYRESSLIDFYKSLDRDKYKNLVQLAMKIFSIFGSTYLCEQTFSIMNLNKNKHRSCLTNENLEDILRTAISSFTPEYEKLVNEKQCNSSH